LENPGKAGGMEGQEDGQITLRAAMLADCKRIWEWRNETATRQGSFRSDRISYAVHKKWFEGKRKEFDKIPDGK